MSSVQEHAQHALKQIEAVVTEREADLPVRMLRYLLDVDNWISAEEMAHISMEVHSAGYNNVQYQEAVFLLAACKMLRTIAKEGIFNEEGNITISSLELFALAQHSKAMNPTQRLIISCAEGVADILSQFVNTPLVNLEIERAFATLTQSQGNGRMSWN